VGEKGVHVRLAATKYTVLLSLLLLNSGLPQSQPLAS